MRVVDVLVVVLIMARMAMSLYNTDHAPNLTVAYGHYPMAHHAKI